MAHSVCKAAARSCTVCIARFLRTRRLNLSQTCSMGLRPRLFAGHSKTLTLFVAKNCLVIAAECGRALSSFVTSHYPTPDLD